MTAHKRLTSNRRHKEIARKRNIRTNNMSVNPWHYIHPSRTYQLVNI